MPDSTATNAASYTTPWDTIVNGAGERMNRPPQGSWQVYFKRRAAN